MEVNTLDNQIKKFHKISKNLSESLIKAFDFAKERGGSTLNGRDLFLAIISNKKSIATKLLGRIGVDVDATFSSIHGNHYQTESSEKPTEADIIFGEEAKKLLSEAYLVAGEMGHVYVGTEHLLLAILKDTEYDFVTDLANNNLNYEYIKSAVQNFGIYQPGIFARNPESGEDEEQQSALAYFARDMNKLAEEGKYLKVWGRELEIERMIHILSRKTKNNPMLIGESGVGKTAIVEGLVQRIVSGNVPPSFKNKKIVQLDVSSIVAGSKIRGDIEERLLGIISEMAQNPDTIIFIDEIHMIVGAGTAGGNSNMDVANILKPYLTNGDLRVIGATTFDEYQKYIEEDDALARRFQTIPVEEINKADAKKVLMMLKGQFEEYHGVSITDQAIEDAVELSDKYVTNKYLPDKAIDVIDEASASKRIAQETGTKSNLPDVRKQLQEMKNKKNRAIDTNNMSEAAKYRQQELELQTKLTRVETNLTKSSKKIIVEGEDVRKVISRWTKVPVTTMRADDLKTLQALEPNLTKRIVGQKEALKTVTAALRRARMGLSDARRPMASFMFLGPTGVGKTETAKEIARTLFGEEDALIQVDMSEFMESHSVSKLIGSPPGYVGYGEGGQLTEKVKRKPYSVILFDEIEKAHPDLLNILLQVLEEGHLQDNKGRSVNFKNTIIIMTSNIGAAEVSQDKVLGFNIDVDDEKSPLVEKAYERLQAGLSEQLKNALPPEFLNRIDNIVIFRGLDATDAQKITRILFDELNKRLEDRAVKLLPTVAVINHIAEAGFSKDYGARNIRRKLQELVENPLADFMLEHRIVDKTAGETVIKLEKSKAEDSKIEFVV